MNQTLVSLIHYLVFPGLGFLACCGMLFSWIDRKLTARLQWRVGPPLFQPYYDLRKLLYKETMIPAGGASAVFIASPFAALAAVLFIVNITALTWHTPGLSFWGDLIVVMYLFTIPAVASIFGAASSNSPYAGLGASREMKALLAYELPFVLCMLVPVIKTGSIRLGAIVEMQRHAGPYAFSLSGAIALAVSLLCIQAKLGLVPFDMAEAETEIAGGTLVEYSGPLLALWKLDKMMLLVAAPLFIAVVFAGGSGLAVLILTVIAMLLMATLLRNINPRLRIDQAIRFFWGRLTVLSAAAVVFALAGY